MFSSSLRQGITTMTRTLVARGHGAARRELLECARSVLIEDAASRGCRDVAQFERVRRAEVARAAGVLATA